MAMLGNQQQEELINDINVTPLVDVMLVLLTVFIVTAPLLMNAISINLPKASTELAIIQPKTLHLSVNAKGEIYLDEQVLGLTALEQKLKALKAQSDPSVEIYADEKTAYGIVAKVMAALQHAGIAKFTFVMLPESGK
ncbi:MAG: biopolymer transporter ExbD [Betaproteobacteria bacterium]|nr:biopolymer transporter ExbD [Betaproteobacteria bacterium]